MAQGGWNLDIETRCTQEVVDAGEVRILQQRNRKKWWRGQRGKSTYEAKWMQEIERHRGGRESSILKQDERKKLLRYAPTYLSSPLSSFNMLQLFADIDFCIKATRRSTALFAPRRHLHHDVLQGWLGARKIYHLGRTKRTPKRRSTKESLD